MIKKILVNAILIYIGAGIVSSLLGNVLELIPYITVSICIVAPILGCIAIKVGSKNKVIKKPKLNLSKFKFNFSINIVITIILGLYLSEVNFIRIITDSLLYGAITIVSMSLIWNIVSSLIKISLPTYSECWKAFV